MRFMQPGVQRKWANADSTARLWPLFLLSLHPRLFRVAHSRVCRQQWRDQKWIPWGFPQELVQMSRGWVSEHILSNCCSIESSFQKPENLPRNFALLKVVQKTLESEADRDKKIIVLKYKEDSHKFIASKKEDISLARFLMTSNQPADTEE